MSKKIKYLLISIVALSCMSLVRPDKEFKVFQFPKDKIPRIDGDFSDWSQVTETYAIGLDELKNTRFGEGEKLNPKDFDIKVKVGWVKDLNRLYFFIDAYDDFWDFNDPALKQDIFEVVIDGDLSGGPFINEENGNINKLSKDQLYFKGHGAHAQNYHVFTPAMGKDWAMVWGSTPWIKEFPYADAAYSYNFNHGEGGRLLMEFYITPFDYASYEGPAHSLVSGLKENELIGLSWSMLDFDGKSCESFMNLSHDWRMINDASFLCAFRLMPLESFLRKPIEANWKHYTENREKRIIRFDDCSAGEITKWHWDFGDGNSSEEKNPVHQYKKSGLWTVVLTVEGPAGKSVRSKVWEVVTN